MYKIGHQRYFSVDFWRLVQILWCAVVLQWVLEHHLTHVVGVCAFHIGSSTLFLKLNFFVCMQTTGGREGYSEAVSPKSVFEELIQGPQCQLQPDDPML